VQIVNNKALLLNLQNPGKVTNTIAKSKIVGGNKVLVKLGCRGSYNSEKSKHRCAVPHRR
jgi:hypothetical protein